MVSSLSPIFVSLSSKKEPNCLIRSINFSSVDIEFTSAGNEASVSLKLIANVVSNKKDPKVSIY